MSAPDNTGPRGEITLQTIAMPADSNANGDIFGGWLMAQMDLGASVLARTRARGRVARHAQGERDLLAGIATPLVAAGTTQLPIKDIIKVMKRLLLL